MKFLRLRYFEDYKTLRAVLDALLAKRFPDVELLTSGGPGVPMLAASYAAERELPIIAVLPELGRFPEVAAVSRRDMELASRADAAVVVWGDREPGVRRLLELVKAKGVPLHVIGGEEPVKVKRTMPPELKAIRQMEAFAGGFIRLPEPDMAVMIAKYEEWLFREMDGELQRVDKKAINTALKKISQGLRIPGWNLILSGVSLMLPHVPAK